ncbi:MAG: esterase-like activity of phytase family protein [Pseudomonadota bacterium]
MTNDRLPSPPHLPIPASLSRRGLLHAGGAAGLSLLGLAGCAQPRSDVSSQAGGAPATLRLIGEARIPGRLQYQGTTVGGLSGIEYNPATDQYFLLPDDASDRNPARFYTARIPLDANGLGQPEITGMTLLRQADGSGYPSSPTGKLLDPESIRWRAGSQTLFWSSEGNARAGVAPSLSESRLDGRLLRHYPMPAMFDFSPTRGPRTNRGFEGMSLTPDGKTAWLALEAAMLQDGPVPTPQMPGGPCRFTQLDLASGKPLRQVAYIPDAIPLAPQPAGAPADNGISEILMLDQHRMLVLERAYMAGYDTATASSLRLYLVDTRQGSDTLDIPALQGANYQPVNKLLLANFSVFVGAGSGKRLDRLDNTEGMTWGPLLANGRRSLVFISDDNFSARQVTQLLAFEFLE